MALMSGGVNNPAERKEESLPKYTMGVAVRLTGVEAGRIRRFEDAGLLEPKRTEGGQRLFTDPEIELIKEIAKLEDEGANLEGIKIILSMRRGERK